LPTNNDNPPFPLVNSEVRMAESPGKEINQENENQVEFPPVIIANDVN